MAEPGGNKIQLVPCDVPLMPTSSFTQPKDIGASCGSVALMQIAVEHAGLVFEQSKTSQLVFPVPVFLILTYNTPQSVSTAEWNTLWLSCISTAGGCLFILLIVLFAKVLTFQKQRFVTPSDMSFEVDGRVHHSTPERSGESRQARDGLIAVSLQSYLDPQHDDSHAGEDAISFQQLSNFHNNGAGKKFTNTKKV